MRALICGIAAVAVALSMGCDSKPTNSVTSRPAGTPQPDTAVLADRANGLAKQILEAMTDPAIMKLPVGPSAYVERGREQLKAAMPFMGELVECGTAAEAPFWHLMNDPDESVRRACTMLLNGSWRDKNGNLMEQQFIGLNIPLLERALKSTDEQVRYAACAGLGDFADRSDKCLQRLRDSLPKLREMRNDGDKNVRSISFIAYHKILRGLSERAKKPEVRKEASEELEKLKSEQGW